MLVQCGLVALNLMFLVLMEDICPSSEPRALAAWTSTSLVASFLVASLVFMGTPFRERNFKRPAVERLSGNAAYVVGRRAAQPRTNAAGRCCMPAIIQVSRSVSRARIS